jgi:hypothetical protein
MNLKLARKNREVKPQSWEKLYKNEIVRRIRQRYSVDDELSIQRQKDEKPEEFAEYNAYVEQCKAEVKKELTI